MTPQCLECRRALEDGRSVSELAPHLDACPSCRAHAALLATLAAIPEPQEDPAAVARIMAALPPAPWQRRAALAWLPLAAGLALVVLGLVLLGGVPAPGAVASLPGAMGALGAWLAAAAVDALAMARGSADAARLLLAAGGAWLVVWLVLTALGSGWGVWVLARSRRARDGS